jgi:Zn finger protein HypA/HybF involved in hydrogenase expression
MTKTIKRPDVVKRNKSKKHIEKVKQTWLKRKKRCDDCNKIVSRQHVKRCRKCAALNQVGKIKENAGYTAIHKWVRKNKPSDNKCESCEIDGKEIKKGLHLANKDHKYKRNIEDWMYLCPKCHRDYDIENGLRITLKGKTHPFYGKKHDKETKQLISKRTKEGMRGFPTPIR